MSQGWPDGRPPTFCVVSKGLPSAQLRMRVYRLCFQRFRLLKLFRGAYRPGEIMERCRHRWMFRTVEIATHLENLARCFFRFGPLPAISQNHTKIAEHIGHLRTVVSTEFSHDSQRFPSHPLGLHN